MLERRNEPVRHRPGHRHGVRPAPFHTPLPGWMHSTPHPRQVLEEQTRRENNSRRSTRTEVDDQHRGKFSPLQCRMQRQGHRAASKRHRCSLSTLSADRRIFRRNPFKNKGPVLKSTGPRRLASSYPAWIRTMTRRTKISCATVTLPGNATGDFSRLPRRAQPLLPGVRRSGSRATASGPGTRVAPVGLPDPR